MLKLTKCDSYSFFFNYCVCSRAYFFSRLCQYWWKPGRGSIDFLLAGTFSRNCVFWMQRYELISSELFGDEWPHRAAVMWSPGADFSSGEEGLVYSCLTCSPFFLWPFDLLQMCCYWSHIGLQTCPLATTTSFHSPEVRIMPSACVLHREREMCMHSWIYILSE